MVKVRVETNVYYRSHMKQPRGRGLWAFAFGKEDGPSQFFSGPYGHAVEQAVAAAKQMAVTVIYVLP